jgi:hypothetical protein
MSYRAFNQRRTPRLLRNHGYLPAILGIQASCALGAYVVTVVSCLPLMIFTSTQWWNYCTASSTALGSTNPLWIANWATDIDTLPIQRN